MPLRIHQSPTLVLSLVILKGLLVPGLTYKRVSSQERSLNLCAQGLDDPALMHVQSPTQLYPSLSAASPSPHCRPTQLRHAYTSLMPHYQPCPHVSCLLCTLPKPALPTDQGLAVEVNGTKPQGIEQLFVVVRCAWHGCGAGMGVG